MTDFETHPVGTAALLDQLRNGVQLTEAAELAADRIEQLEAELTRANAATAAAYAVAAQYLENPTHQGIRPAWGMDIRSLATPDQTAALDRLIAEAKADALAGPWDDKPDAMTPAIIASYPHITKDYETWAHAMELVSARRSKGALVALVNHILAASKKGGV